jgi:hypothetical protein
MWSSDVLLTLLPPRPLLSPAPCLQIEYVHMLYTKGGHSEGVPEAPPVPVVITAAGQLPPGTALGDDNAPLFMGGGYPMWADDQVCVWADKGGGGYRLGPLSPGH